MADRNRTTSGNSQNHSRSKERNQGGQESKKPLFGNLVWTREPAMDKERLAASLLSRIQQTPISLLDRIGSPNIKSEPETDIVGGFGGAANMQEDMVLGNNTTRRVSQPSRSDLKMADIIIASALKDATKSAPPAVKSEPVQSTAIPESAVSDSIAHTSANELQDSNLSTSGSSMSQSGGTDATLSRAELIEQAKQLLIPIITQNARLRDPEADEETIRSRVMTTLTDEQCLDFAKIARNLRSQIRSGGRNMSPGGNSTIGATKALTSSAGSSVAQETDLSNYPGGIYDARGPLDPIRKNKAPVAGNIITSASQPSAHSQNDSPTSPTTPTMSPTQTASATMTARSPPRAPKAMREALQGRRLSYSDPAIPSNPSALRLAASPYEAAYQRRRTPSPKDAITSLPSPHRVRHDSVPVERGGATQPASTAVVADQSPAAVLPENTDSTMPLENVEQSSSSRADLASASVVTNAASEGPIHATPMVVDKPLEEVPPPPTTEPPPLPVEEVITVKVEQDAVAESILTGSIDTGEPEQALQVPIEVIGDRVEHDASQEMTEDRSGTTSGTSIDVIEPAESRSQNVSEKENPVTQEESTEIATVSEPALTADAPLQLPSLLYVTTGGRTPDVLDIVFEVNESLASATRRWSAGQASYDASSSYASVYLLCLPTAEVTETYTRIGLTATAEEYGDTLWNIKTRWPPQGKLLIEINSGKSTHCTFIPQQLGPNDGPLEVSKFIEPGKNTLRLIQLADSSSHLFVLLAREPLARELKWFSFVRSFNSLPPLTPGSVQNTPTVAACH